MAREIKFRGFSRNKNGKTTIIIDGKKVKGDWVYGDLVNSKISVFKPTNKFVVIIESSFMNGGFFAAARKYLAFKSTVGQFTGLHDKNGKEIYEGDVVTNKWQNNKKQYVVEFSTEDIGSCGCCYGEFSGSGFVGQNGSERCRLGIRDEIEIIGNIHTQS